MFRGDRPPDKVENADITNGNAFAPERRLREANDASLVRHNNDGSTERSFRTQQGQNLTLRIEGNADEAIRQTTSEQRVESQHAIRLRVYDTDEAKSDPPFKGKGERGRANLTLEIRRDASMSQQERRLHLNDIVTHRAHRGKGVGSVMLREAENIGRQWGAREIYGSLSYESEDEAAVRGFYQKHGFGFRPMPHGGEEVWKSLQQDSDAAALRRYRR